MGDRANVLVLDQYDESAAPVVLYTHWGGYALPATLARALGSDNGRGRWSDGPYLARIIFQEMTRGHEDSETGFGISTGLCDNEHPLLVVDPKAQEVRVIGEMDFGRARDPEVATARFSFAEFAEKGATLWGDES